MIEFIWFWALWFLPLPLLIRYLFPAARVQQDASLRVPFIEDFQQIDSRVSVAGKPRKWPLFFATLAWCCLVLAAMRPQWVGEPIELPTSGRDLMLAVDLSGSMQAEDFKLGGVQLNRLMATQMIASEFIERRVGDRVGLILFGRQAYLQTPLTFDRKTVKTLLNEAVIGLAGQETAIGDAIGLMVKRLKDQTDVQQVLILLTDGANTAGEVAPLKAAELAAEKGLKIYTIGIGADEMIVRSLFGSQRVNPSMDLDEETLTAIADATGGKYFRARDLKELVEVYEEIDKLEPTEQEAELFRPLRALFIWPLGAAIGLISLMIVLQGLAGLLNRRGQHG